MTLHESLPCMPPARMPKADRGMMLKPDSACKGRCTRGIYARYISQHAPLAQSAGALPSPQPRKTAGRAWRLKPPPTALHSPLPAHLVLAAQVGAQVPRAHAQQQARRHPLAGQQQQAEEHRLYYVLWLLHRRHSVSAAQACASAPSRACSSHIATARHQSQCSASASRQLVGAPAT